MRTRSLWTWHVLSAAVILVVLGLHMTIMHLDVIVGAFNPAGGHPIEWANVTARAGSVFFTVTYVLLLGAALFHGFYGVRNIILELNPAPGVQTFVTGALVVVGMGLFALGTWAIVAGFQNAQAA